MSPSPQKMYQSIPDTVGLPNLCRFFVLFEFPFPRPVLRALYLFNPEGPRFHRPRCLTRFATVRFQKVHTVDGRNPKQPPGMYKTLWIMGGTTNLNWLAGFLNHQQYYLACISIQWDRASTEILYLILLLVLVFTCCCTSLKTNISPIDWWLVQMKFPPKMVPFLGTFIHFRGFFQPLTRFLA